MNENMHMPGSLANVCHYKGFGINFRTIDELSDRQKFNEFRLDFLQLQGFSEKIGI